MTTYAHRNGDPRAATHPVGTGAPCKAVTSRGYFCPARAVAPHGYCARHAPKS